LFLLAACSGERAVAGICGAQLARVPIRQRFVPESFQLLTVAVVGLWWALQKLCFSTVDVCGGPVFVGGLAYVGLSVKMSPIHDYVNEK
jgi:hypothetical protein